MSHFTVLVIGENPESQLAPFQENNMNDCPKEYLTWHSVMDDYDTIEKAVKDGFELKEGVPGYWENPNAKWDWHVLGGRWTGYFKIKQNANAIVGRPGLMTPPAREGYADQLRKSEIDILGMIVDVTSNSKKRYSDFIKALEGESIPPKWEDFRAAYESIDDARKDYGLLQSVKNIRKANYFFFDEFLTTEDNYIQESLDSMFATHAVIKDGKWYERGEMGWWGVVHEQKDNWNEEFMKMFNELPDDTLLSVYDCHI